jgi:hypothetical protein
MKDIQRQKRVLLLYYSFSGQTAGLLGRLIAGLQEEGAQVVVERLRPSRPLSFPVGTIPATVKMMAVTACRRRVAIGELSARCRTYFDLVVLAGPTWSYNPSGPILALLDRDGSFFAGQTVLPLISCRGYWRLHWFELQRRLKNCGASVPNLMVFTHPHPEPWRTIGVFLKIAGRSPEAVPLLRNYYSRYGHGRQQLLEARRFGTLISRTLREGGSLAALDFRTAAARGR